MKALLIAFSIFAIAGSSFAQAPILPARSVGDTLTLLAPGHTIALSTASTSTSTAGAITRWFYTTFSVGIHVTNINTTASFQVQGKMKKLDQWATLDAVNDSIQFAANGTVYRVYDFAPGIDSVRVAFLAESGGTAATPTIQTILFNKYFR